MRHKAHSRSEQIVQLDSSGGANVQPVPPLCNTPVCLQIDSDAYRFSRFCTVYRCSYNIDTQTTERATCVAIDRYQDCKRLLHKHSGALLTADRQCGTVCQQHRETVACLYTHSSCDWKRTYLQHDEHHPALLWRFCESGAVTYDSWLTYLIKTQCKNE